MGDVGLLVFAAMQLADRWRRPLAEVLDMTMLEFSLWREFHSQQDKNNGA